MSWMRFNAWYLVSDLWVVFIALSLFVAWWEGHLGFKNLLRSCLFGDATQLGISVEMGHVSSQLNFTASLLALRLYSRWPLYVLMYASICLQGIYVSKPIYNCIVHLHEFVCSGVWCVVNYCRGFSWCYLAGKYRMNGWTIALWFPAAGWNKSCEFSFASSHHTSLSDNSFLSFSLFFHCFRVNFWSC